MKDFNITFNLRGEFKDETYFDMDTFTFLESLTLDQIEEELALFLLLFEHDSIKLDLIHVDESHVIGKNEEDHDDLAGV